MPLLGATAALPSLRVGIHPGVSLSLALLRSIGSARPAPPFRFKMDQLTARSVSAHPLGCGGASPWRVNTLGTLLASRAAARPGGRDATVSAGHARSSAVRAIDPTGCGSRRPHASFRGAVVGRVSAGHLSRTVRSLYLHPRLGGGTALLGSLCAGIVPRTPRHPSCTCTLAPMMVVRVRLTPSRLRVGLPTFTTLPFVSRGCGAVWPLLARLAAPGSPAAPFGP